MITIFIDGACEPMNPGGHGACAFIAYWGRVLGGKDNFRPEHLGKAVKLIGHGPGMTNNVAEWRALRGALWWLSTRRPDEDEISIFMDSQLVVNQFNDQWQCRAPELQIIMAECRALMSGIKGTVVLNWIPRDQNWVADNLINELYAKHNIHVTVRKKKPKKNTHEQTVTS
jgi:ribonuclease HI